MTPYLRHINPIRHIDNRLDQIFENREELSIRWINRATPLRYKVIEKSVEEQIRRTVEATRHAEKTLQ